MKYTVNEKIVSYPAADNEFVLYNAEREELIVVNDAGRILWEALTADDELQRLMETSDYLNDIKELLKVFEEKGYIVRA